MIRMNAESYLVMFFTGFLGLFNSASLEVRQLTDSNAELVFQNGMIISATLMAVSIAGCIGETIAVVKHQKKLDKTVKRDEEKVKRLQQTVDVYDKIKIVATTNEEE